MSGQGITILNSLKPNPDNPRTISDQQKIKLKAKLKSLPQMLTFRPIVHKDGIVYGGNQRLEALKQLASEGFEVKPEYFANADGWTDQQLKQFIVTDNLSDGDWDLDILNASYSPAQLEEWGLELPSYEELPIGLPEGDKPGLQQITFTLSDAQAAVVHAAVGRAKAKITGDEDNSNANGNALFYICEAYQ